MPHLQHHATAPASAPHHPLSTAAAAAAAAAPRTATDSDRTGHVPSHDRPAESHESHAHHPQATGWRTALLATLHCLTGCAIGEVLGLAIGTAAGLPNAPTIALSIVLAFFFGYALTARGVRRAGLPFRQAARIALAADTVSIAVMELIDNTVVATVPGAMDAGLADGLFWSSLAGALLAAFVVATPVNRRLISRGKGHAVVHGHHGHHGH